MQFIRSVFGNYMYIIKYETRLNKLVENQEKNSKKNKKTKKGLSISSKIENLYNHKKQYVIRAYDNFTFLEFLIFWDGDL